MFIVTKLGRSSGGSQRPAWDLSPHTEALQRCPGQVLCSGQGVPILRRMGKGMFLLAVKSLTGRVVNKVSSYSDKEANVPRPSDHPSS